MSKNGIRIVLLFSLFLMMFSVRGYAEPMWYNPTNVTPVNYEPSSLSQFNVTWTNDVNMVFITIANSTNVLINNATMSNATYGGDIYHYSVILPAGTWNWISYSNDNLNNWNSTGTTTLINKADTPVRLFLNGTEGSRNFTLYNNATFNASLGVSGKTINLNSTLPDWATLTNDTLIVSDTTNLSTSGLYAMTAYFLGDQNYSFNYTTYYIGVMPYWINNKTSVNSGSLYSQGQLYQFNITWIGNIANVLFESDFNGTLVNYTNFNNDTNNYWINFTDLRANVNFYNYRWYATDSNGYSIATNQWNYNISRIPVSLFWSSPTSWTVNVGTNINVICYSDPIVNLTLEVGGFPPVYSTTLGTVSIPILSSTSNSYSCTCRPLNSNHSGSISNILVFQTTSTSQQSSSSSSSSGTSSSSTGTFTITDLASTISVEAGKSKSTTFQIKSTYTNNMQNVNITLSGIDSSWYSIAPQKISLLKRNIPETVTITFNIPSSAEAKSYSINITAKGTPLLESLKTTTQKITLTVTSPPQPTQQTPANETIEKPVTTASTETTEQNITSNQTAGPGGFATAIEYLREYSVLIIGIIACLLVFGFRKGITSSLVGFRGVRPAEKPEEPTVKPKKQLKLPSLSNYKLVLNLKKAKPKKEIDTVIKEEPVEERKKSPEQLETEIKDDIKELKKVLKEEEKLKKKK